MNIFLHEIKIINYYISRNDNMYTYFFKPVKYNNCLYVDPGLKNAFPILKCKSKNYLGILLGGGCGDFSENKLFNERSYFIIFI